MEKLIEEIATKAREAWVAENVTNNKITRLVTSKLESASNKILMKLLGFDSRYGNEWDLDHCNGRSGNSPIGQEVKKLVQGSIDEWMSKLQSEKIKPEISDLLMTKLSARYHSLLERELQIQITSLVKQNAFNMIEKNADLICDSKTHANKKAIMALESALAATPSYANEAIKIIRANIESLKNGKPIS
jgi:hypothetical protein